MNYHAMRYLFVASVTLLLTIVAYSQATVPFTFTDPFTNYTAGSDGAPNWKINAGSAWKVNNGVLQANTTAKQFLEPAKSPVGKTIRLQATMTVRAAVGKGWNTTGIAIRQDDTNFWHLAFVESPAENNNAHYVELCEMYNKTWLAQGQTGTKLTRKESSGDLKWEYNHPYKMIIELSSDGIRGQVTEMDGKVRVSIAYKFDAPAITQGRPALTVAGFNTDFDDVSVSVSDVVPAVDNKK